MAPKPKAHPRPAAHASRANVFKDRMGLGAYLEDPASFPASVVIQHSDDFVVIHDRFPKATIHTLIIPRSAGVNLRHPFDAFEDPAFLASVQAETRRVKTLVAGELRRRLGAHSRSDAARQAVLNGEVEAEAPARDGSLPAGRDWAAEVVCGVHAVPSMSHLHVHVLSRDMRSPQLRHRKHYNSFATPFLVDLADFPLAADDPRRDTRRSPYLSRDLVCWRCGRNFGARFQSLKRHLDEEFEEWRRL